MELGMTECFDAYSIYGKISSYWFGITIELRIDVGCTCINNNTSSDSVEVIKEFIGKNFWKIKEEAWWTK